MLLTSDLDWELHLVNVDNHYWAVSRNTFHY